MIEKEVLQGLMAGFMISYCDEEDIQHFTAWELFCVNPDVANMLFCGYCMAHGHSLETLSNSMEAFAQKSDDFWEGVDDQMVEYKTGLKH